MLLKGKRIFYVEDDVRNRAIVQLVLEQHGATMDFERWGKDTIERLRAFAPIDIILLDLMFPDRVTGYDVYQAIRREPEFDHIPIVAVSAADPAIEMSKTRAMGFDGFISKPIHLVVFPKQILSVLQGQHIWYGG